MEDTIMKTPETVDRQVWHVPPRCQGQAVEDAYAADGTWYWHRVRWPDGDVLYEALPIDEAPEGAVWEPWNDEPDLAFCPTIICGHCGTFQMGLGDPHPCR